MTEELLPLWDGLEYFPHQEEAIHWMLLREKEPLRCDIYGKISYITGGLLCDEMGAGKTNETLALLMNNPLPQTLILVPKAVVENWTTCAVRAGFQVYNIEGSGERALWHPKNASASATEVYITNYQSILYKQSLFAFDWDRLVLDEAHVIRNHTTKLTKAVMKLAEPVRFKWAVTGTPVVNRDRDAVTLLAFIGVPASKSCAYVPQFYDALLPHLVCHRSMDDLREAVADMPAKPEITSVVVDFTNEDEEEYYADLQGMARRMKAAFAAGRRAEGLLLLLRLRQASISPAIRNPEWTEPSGKMLTLQRLVEDEPDEKFLVFCWFHREMELLEEMLGRRGIQSESYHGALSLDERTDILEKARGPECQVLLIQIQCGGVGINLQEFSRVVFMTPYWTSAMMEQAIGRTVRIGQKKVVRVFHLLLSTEIGINIDTMTAGIAERKRIDGIEFLAKAGAGIPGNELVAVKPRRRRRILVIPSNPDTPEGKALTTLGLATGASPSAIRKAFLALCLRYHPDKDPDGRERFEAIHNAYCLLTPA